jgi:signal transduction histidine kinase
MAHLSIGNKIRTGYAIALSITVLGSIAGTIIGNAYAQNAEARAKAGHETGVLLKDLQVSMLQVETHQHQLATVLRQPKEFQANQNELRESADRIQTLIAKSKTSDEITLDQAAKTLFQQYAASTATYLQQLEQSIQIDPNTLTPDQIAQTQQRLSEFATNETAKQFHDFSDKLSEVGDAAFEREERAELVVAQAKTIGLMLTTLLSLLSLGVAAVLAMYTSRAIARPIEAVTETAQRVTKEANFDLQAPVTTTDEVGTLATSLNELIQQVKTLMAEQQANANRKLIQTEKMSSLGRMLAGVAHEINNPVNFIFGNLEHTRQYMNDLLDLLDTYEVAITNPPDHVKAKAEEIEVEFLKEDLQKILQSMEMGADRVRQIVLHLKNFSRLDEAQPHLVNLHNCIDSTLLILNNRLKKGVVVERNYGDIPEIDGFSGALYQVFMNILSNALDALEETKVLPPKVTIASDRLNLDQVQIQITDNGTGIAPENLTRIFENFFTTKPIGVGTGLGLSISYQIVVEQHRGQLTCTSELGVGTTFTMTLPMRQRSNFSIAAANPEPQMATVS